MKIGRISRSFANAIKQVLHSAADSNRSGGFSSPLKQPLADGSGLIGDHNFRTGRADSGNDPVGWYEDDF